MFELNHYVVTYQEQSAYQQQFTWIDATDHLDVVYCKACMNWFLSYHHHSMTSVNRDNIHCPECDHFGLDFGMVRRLK